MILRKADKWIDRHFRNTKKALLRILAYANEPLNWEKTLIFFDEVEEYPDVMTWVKAFVDKGYHLALSGSLLGGKIPRVSRCDSRRLI